MKFELYSIKSSAQGFLQPFYLFVGRCCVATNKHFCQPAIFLPANITTPHAVNKIVVLLRACGDSNFHHTSAAVAKIHNLSNGPG